MTPRTRLWLVLAALLAALGVIAFWFIRQATVVVDAPQPILRPELADTLPSMSSSVVEAPVTYDLDTALDSLEAAVPKTYGNLDQRIETARNKKVKFAFLLHRSPFRVRVQGQTLTISADIEYSGRVWYQPPIGPEVEISCGTDSDVPRRATLTIESAGELTRDWGLRTKSRVVRLEAYTDSARDHCRLTFLRIDVTERVLETARVLVDDNLARFDQAVARWPVRPRFEKIWSQLQIPLHLADSVYLTINPSAAQIGSIGAHGRTAFAHLRLVASPRVITGPRPTLPRVPLPPLERAGDVGRGARVLMDASITYPVATSMLKRSLVGKGLRLGGRPVRIRDVRLFGIGAGKIAMGVGLSGAVSGRLFLTGTPSFNVQEHQIVVPDLDFDVGTAQILVKGYEWLYDVKLRDFLRERTRLPDSSLVRRLSQLAESGLNRKLPARGTKLSGRIDQAGVIAVQATLREIRVRAVADANLTLSINRAPSIPRPPELPGANPEDDEDQHR